MAGMQLTAIDQAGENVWRIRLRDRLRGQPQSIDLAIQLPVTRQWWFWTMFGVMALSLLAAVWRYVAWLHLQRAHVLVEERARIARDLHDGMGADLTRISLLVEIAARQPGVPPATRQALGHIVANTHTLATELDSVVWATDPRHDTLEHLVQYLTHFAQSFLEPAGIHLRLVMPPELPAITIDSATRHHLFLAAKEALNNIVRHAAATTVFLRVHVRDHSLVIEIEDDGRGLAGRDPAAPGADGLRNIANRMAKMNGHCEYLPGADGHGTLARLRLPLKDPDNTPKS
jgi:signal transduction histidine kinase